MINDNIIENSFKQNDFRQDFVKISIASFHEIDGWLKKIKMKKANLHQVLNNHGVCMFIAKSLLAENIIAVSEPFFKNLGRGVR